MMTIIGNALLGGHGTAFMLMEALTVFLALIGTTLSCINTGARVTYAMGRDEEVPEHFGMLHGKNLTPHRAIWYSQPSRRYSVHTPRCSTSPADRRPMTRRSRRCRTTSGTRWHEFERVVVGVAQRAAAGHAHIELRDIPALWSDDIVCIVAYSERHEFHGFKHMVVPVFGAIANFACLAFYIIGPLEGLGSVKEPLMAVAISAIWGIYGGITSYVTRRRRAKRRFS